MPSAEKSFPCSRVGTFSNVCSCIDSRIFIFVQEKRRAEKAILDAQLKMEEKDKEISAIKEKVTQALIYGNFPRPHLHEGYQVSWSDFV